MFQVLFHNFHRFDHFGEKLAISGWMCATVWNSLKNLKVGVFETDYRASPIPI